MKSGFNISFRVFITLAVYAVMFSAVHLYGFDYQNNIAGQNIMDTDSSKIQSIDYKEGKGFVAIDKNGIELFTVFPFDNGPDYASEGLFRIIENGKIGYANEYGEIVIQPQFKAALPFQNGLAAFCNDCSEIIEGEHKSWKGGKWGFIDMTGSVVISPTFDRVVRQFYCGTAEVEYEGSVIDVNKNGRQVNMDNIKYNRWINLLGQSLKLVAKIFFNDSIKVKMQWLHNDKFIFSAVDYLEYLRINILDENGRDCIEYNIIPWQNFAVSLKNDFLISLEELSTVTDYAVIYSLIKPREKNKNDLELIKKFESIFSSLIERDINQELNEEKLVYPESVQFISTKEHRNYVDLQVAEPGSTIPENSEWMKVCSGKMLYLQIIPDIGPSRKRWIKTQYKNIDTYYTSVEDDLLNLFDNALSDAYNSPQNRNEIFYTAKSKMRSLFNAANSYVNYLYDKYEKRLKNWTFASDQVQISPDAENMFADYQPKLTPDTILDYMPELTEAVKKLPAAELTNLTELFRLLKLHQKKAVDNPGYWEEGNMILGANPKEYNPSIDELLSSEIGNRIAVIISNESEDKIRELMQKDGFTINNLEYTKYTFIHVDVMGSGRFFYVHDSKKIIIDLENSK